MLWLIEKSEKFTNPVALCFTLNENVGYDVAKGHHDMVSANRKTHLNRFAKELGIPMIFSQHVGYFLNRLFRVEPDALTVWLAYEHCEYDVQVFHDTPEIMAEISAIQLTA